MAAPIISSYALQYENSDVSFDALAASSIDLFITNGAPFDPVDRRPFSDDHVAALKAQGRAVAGYVDVSVTDDARYYWLPEWTEDGTDRTAPDGDAPSWLQGALPFPNAANQVALVVRFEDPLWQQMVVDQAVELIERGYSGVFLDDVGRYYQWGEKTGNFALAADQMIALISKVRSEILKVNAAAFVVVNADPYIVVNATGGAGGAAAQAYRAAVDYHLLENHNLTVLNDAAQHLGSEPLLILNSVQPPRVTFQQAWDHGVLYTAPNTNYDSLGSSDYPSTENSDILTGGDGPNLINGLGGDDRIDGGRGDDRLIGGPGADAMRGGPGNDTYSVDQAGDTIFETAGEGTDLVQSSVSFTLSANVERLTLTGTAAVNGTGNTLANLLTGNAAANRLDGGAGADTMAGGFGFDIYVVDHAGDKVTESDAAGGRDTVLSSVAFMLGNHVENLTLTGLGSIGGTGNALANTITGNGGANLLNGAGGADVMIGGLGFDTYVVNHEGDKVVESDPAGGRDTVRSSVSFALPGNVENLELTGFAKLDGTGNALANGLTGNAAANRLNGGGGADSMAGMGGDDLYVVDNIGDRVIETDPAGGVDTVQSSLSWTLNANVENLILTGFGNLDGTGNSLANRITGNGGSNKLGGGIGDDRLYGGAGNDTLKGGSGADGFFFDTAPGAANIDGLADFNPADDTIHLSRAVFAGLAGGGPIGPGAFRAGTAAGDSNDRILYDSATGKIFYDADGIGGAAAIQFATVAPGTAITHLDFIAY